MSRLYLHEEDEMKCLGAVACRDRWWLVHAGGVGAELQFTVHFGNGMDLPVLVLGHASDKG